MSTDAVTPDRRSRDRVMAGNVLVVDDSVATRRILSRALLNAGYRVTEAPDGQQAIDACRAERPDLVLLDVDMPVMDGLTALREIRADRSLAGLPVLFLTARTAGADVAAGLELGAQDYLRKPCEPAELVARVAAALRIKAQQDLLQRQADEMDALSTTDALTGLGNRRRLDAHAAALAAESGSATPVAVCMVDIDHFKMVNDTEGHAVGDVVLRIVGGRMRNAVTDAHLLVRWGGEEFVVVALGLDEAEVADLGESLRRAVADAPFAITGGPILPVTVSVGCACGTVGDVSGALEAADVALYEAKRAGRNQVRVAAG